MDLITPPDAIHEEEGILHKKLKTGEHGLALAGQGNNAGEHGLVCMQGLGSDCGDNLSELTRDGMLHAFPLEKTTQLLPHLSLIDIDRLIRCSSSSSGATAATDIAGDNVHEMDIPYPINTTYYSYSRNTPPQYTLSTQSINPPLP